MASRETIKNAVLSEIETAVSGLVPSSDVYHAGAEREETRPAVTYNAFGRQVRYNNASVAVPARYAEDATGAQTQEVYHTYYRLRFDVTVYGENAIQTEQIYEALVDHFIRYELHVDEETVHSHIRDIAVDSSDDETDLSTSHLTAADVLTLHVEYLRETTRDGEPIDQIHIEIDADLDDSTGGVNYTVQ